MKKIAIVILAILVLGIPAILCFGASNEIPNATWGDSTVAIAQPVDVIGWVDGVDQATNTTTSPYQPSVAATTYVDGTTVSSPIYVRNFSGVLIRAVYDKFAVVTTNPIVRAWGYRNSSWQALPDSAGNYDITLSSDTEIPTQDVYDGANFCYRTAPVKVPSLGCFKVIFTMKTAYSVTFPTSTVVEITRY